MVPKYSSLKLKMCEIEILIGLDDKRTAFDFFYLIHPQGGKESQQDLQEVNLTEQFTLIMVKETIQN